MKLPVAYALLFASAVLTAQDARYEGKVTAIEKTRLQITETTKDATRRVWLGITDQTPVINKDVTLAWAAAKLKKNAVIAVTVAKGDEVPGKEWSCTMHTHVAEAGPGKCPVCSMALVERDRALPAKAIHVVKR